MNDREDDAVDSQPKTISVCFSFRNEEAVLDELIRRVESVLDATSYEYELVFVNDTSTDRSLEILQRHIDTDPHIRVVNMSSRFGVMPCFYAAMEYAKGDAVITMDADLQDPPEVMPELLERWESGAHVVNTTRTARRGESPFKMFITKWGYRFINAIADVELPVDSGLFKLMDRRVVDVLLDMDEQDPYLRGLINWVGFRQDQVFYEREARYAGETHFPLFSVNPIREFAVGVISFSRVPLTAILVLGLIVTGIALPAFGLLALAALFGADVGLPHFTLAVLTLLAGTQLLGLGIIGLYLGRAYRQTRGRPHYIVQERLGFPDD